MRMSGQVVRLLCLVVLLLLLVSGISGGGVLGPNYYEIKSSVGFTTTLNSWATQNLVVNIPLLKYDWTVAVVLMVNFTTVNPGNVEMGLIAPTLYKTYPTMSGIYGYLAGCPTFSVPFYDNQTMWGSSNSTIVCNKTSSLGAYGYAYSYNDNWECFNSGCNPGSLSGTPVTDPFARAYALGGGTINGTWNFGIYDVNSQTGTLHSWTLQFYREIHPSSIDLLDPQNNSLCLFLLVRGVHW